MTETLLHKADGNLVRTVSPTHWSSPRRLAQTAVGAALFIRITLKSPTNLVPSIIYRSASFEFLPILENIKTAIS
jgi:hypothetical protein